MKGFNPCAVGVQFSPRVRASPAGWHGSGGGFAGLWMAVLDWHDLWRSRRALLRLSDAHLRDIGLTRESALEEVRLSFLADD